MFLSAQSNSWASSAKHPANLGHKYYDSIVMLIALVLGDESMTSQFSILTISNILFTILTISLILPKAVLLYQGQSIVPITLDIIHRGFCL
jgi:hypothetical protein